jgi:hypothetical protein
MWVLVGASPTNTGPTLNGQPDIEDLKAGRTVEKPSVPSESECLRPAHYYGLVHVEPRKIPPGSRQ